MPRIMEFHDTDHAGTRGTERGFSIEQAHETVENPDSILKHPPRKGNHGGFIRLFFRKFGDSILVVVAEVKGDECWIITGYWS